MQDLLGLRGSVDKNGLVHDLAKVTKLDLEASGKRSQVSVELLADASNQDVVGLYISMKCL